MISIGFSFLSVTNEMVADIEVINNTKSELKTVVEIELVTNVMSCA